MKQIRRFGVVQTAKVAGVLYLIIGVVFGVLLFVFSSFFGTRGLMGGGIMALVFPIVYAIVGFIFTAIACALYNVVSGWVGGIEIELD